MNIEQLRELIKTNKEVNEALQSCSDDFLLVNINLILAALDPEKVEKDHKIVLEVNEEENVLTWTFEPISGDPLERSKIDAIKKNYKYKLPKDQEQLYLLNINNSIQWHEGREDMRNSVVKITSLIKENNEIIKGYWFWGKTDSGKTWASIALLNRISELGKTVAFVSVPELILKTQNSYNINSYSQDYENHLDQIMKADVIVIDDLGSERPTPWFKQNILFTILDYRFKSNKTTIFTSNSNIESYEWKLNQRSQYIESEMEINEKIVSRIKSLIEYEVIVKG